jgi:hypothetical protein
MTAAIANNGTPAAEPAPAPTSYRGDDCGRRGDEGAQPAIEIALFLVIFVFLELRFMSFDPLQLYHS